MRAQEKQAVTRAVMSSPYGWNGRLKGKFKESQKATPVTVQINTIFQYRSYHSSSANLEVFSSRSAQDYASSLHRILSKT